MKPLRIGSSGNKQDLIKANELAAILIPKGVDCMIVDSRPDILIAEEKPGPLWIYLGKLSSRSLNRHFKVFGSPDLRKSSLKELSTILQTT